MDNDKTTTAADTLKLLILNQIAIRTALDEVSLRINQRGSTDTHGSILGALETLDRNAEAIFLGYSDYGQSRLGSGPGASESHL